MNEKYYTIQEVAKMFKVSTTTVRSWIYEQKILQAYKIGGSVRISQKNIEKFKKIAR